MINTDDLLNHKVFQCDYFKQWIQFRGIKINSFKTLTEVEDEKTLDLFFEKSFDFFRANPSYSDGMLVSGILIELIKNGRYLHIPSLVLGDRFQWHRQVEIWMTELVKLRNESQNKIKSVDKNSPFEKNRKKLVFNENTNIAGLQFKIQPVSNGIYINAFVSDENGMQEFLKILENVKRNLNLI